MNKLLKVTLITAIMATSGMCSMNPYQAFPPQAQQQDSCGPMMKFAIGAATGYVAYKLYCNEDDGCNHRSDMRHREKDIKIAELENLLTKKNTRIVELENLRHVKIVFNTSQDNFTKYTRTMYVNKRISDKEYGVWSAMRDLCEVKIEEDNTLTHSPQYADDYIKRMGNNVMLCVTQTKPAFTCFPVYIHATGEDGKFTYELKNSNDNDEFKTITSNTKKPIYVTTPEHARFLKQLDEIMEYEED